MSKKKRFKSRKQSTSLNNIETKVFNILNQLKISFRTQVTIDKYNVDFLIDDKYIIEVYGDFWHCNPQKYTPDFYNKGKKKTAKEIWERDMCRKEKFESKGFKFLHLWESDINKNPKSIKNKIKQLVTHSKRGK